MSPNHADDSDNAKPAPDAAASSEARALVPTSAAKVPRAPMVIDARANEKPPEPDASKTAAAGAPKAWHGLAQWRVAAAAAIALGIGAGAGYSGGSTLGGGSGQSQAIASQLNDIRAKIAAMDGQLASEDAASTRAHVAALRADLDKTRSSAAAQANQLAARIDKLDHDTSARFDKDGHDTAARLDRIEKSLMARDATASIRALPEPPAPPPPTVAPPSTVAPIAAVPAKTRVPPGGWVLLGVRDGIARVEGPNGVLEVQAGDMLPGAGRVRGIERRAGQWVVVTNLGYVDQNRY